MQYMLLIYGAESGFAGMSEEALQKMYAGYMAVSKEMAEAGVMQGGAELKPVSSATTMRIRNGKVLTTDGPFAETKEQLGGYYLIDVANLDEALKWAAKIPSALDGAEYHECISLILVRAASPLRIRRVHWESSRPTSALHPDSVRQSNNSRQVAPSFPQTGRR